MSTLEMPDIDTLLDDGGMFDHHLMKWIPGEPIPPPGSYVIALCGELFMLKGEMAELNDPNLCERCRTIAQEIWQNYQLD